MTIRGKIRLGLAAKLAALMVASTAAFFALYGYLNLREQMRHSEETVVQAAEWITDVILRSTQYGMLHNDRDALYNIVQELGSEPGIRRIRIFNKDGRISFSTDTREVNTVVDKRAEACYGCHAQQAPLTRLARRDRARIFPDPKGGRLLGVIRPIENREVCSQAACHAHPAGQRVLGVIDANLTLASVDARAAGHRHKLLYFTLGAGVLASLMSVVFVWLVVHRPVRALIDGMRRVAGGDLSHRLNVSSDDELGQLASSFNRMTAEVAGVQAEIEERVRRKTAELERVHKSLLGAEKMASIGKLAATVAHEINNPLFGILTYARLLLRELMKHEIPNRDEMAGQLQIIERESRRCGDIVKNLLAFSRQAPSHRDSNDLNDLVERSLSLIRHKLDLQSIELRTHYAEQLPPVFCDANQIQQVILVLLVNASEAMAQGGLLEVSTTFDAAAEHGAVHVKDNGSGIPPDLLPKIFDPFFTTKEDQLRTGLGLAVARSIVEQHGGEIHVQSSPGQGTEFIVTVPLSAMAASPADRR